MLLYVLRHGKAGEGYPDEIRELTDRGREDLKGVLERRGGDMKELDQIQSSPLVRAQQTAEIAAEALGIKAPIENNDCLVPWASPSEFLNTLDENLKSLLVASHQTFVSELVEHLTGRRVAMATSALAAIRLDYPADGGGELLWLESR